MDSSMMELLTSDWKGCRGEPFTADEILCIGKTVFEPLFHEPPVGPIPEYLVTHWSVFGCVAEYEERIEELDRWKARQLSRWLKDRIGRHWCLAGRVYELQSADGDGAACDKFRLIWIEDLLECGKLISLES